jgi:hypothetical protein
MRFMVMVKANPDTEAGQMPTAELLRAMNAYNQRLIDAGVLLTGEGLQRSALGARVVFDGADRTVVDGPFAETKELVAGFWLFRCASLEECVAWVKQCPNPTGDHSVIEIRQVFEAEDFGEFAGDELREEAEAAMALVSGRA